MYRDKTLSPEERAKALLSEMTLDDKFDQMHIYGNIQKPYDFMKNGIYEARSGTFQYTTKEMLQEIQRNEILLGNILGGEGYWLRPPYGLIGPEVVNQLRVPMVKWSVDPRDWESRNTEAIVKAVLKEVRPGSIILLHDIYEPSVDAALRLVDELQARGYWFVTVEELLQLNGITPEAGALYRCVES